MSCQECEKLRKILVDQCQVKVNPPIMIVQSVDEAFNHEPYKDMSLARQCRVRGFTIEGYERLIEKNRKLERQIEGIKEVLGIEEDEEYYD